MTALANIIEVHPFNGGFWVYDVSPTLLRRLDFFRDRAEADAEAEFYRATPRAVFLRTEIEAFSMSSNQTDALDARRYKAALDALRDEYAKVPA